MSTSRTLAGVALVAAVSAGVIAAVLHVAFPHLTQDNPTDEDHMTTIILTVTDAPHIFLAFAALILRNAAMEKRKALSSSSASSSSIFASAHVQSLIVAVAAVALGAALQEFGSVDHLYVPLTYVVVLHTISQVVFMVQQASVSELSFAALTGTGDADDSSGKTPAASTTTNYFWWSPSLLRPRGFDAFLALITLLCPVLVWFMDAERGLDWFHWQLPLPVVVPRGALPVVSVVFVVAAIVQLVRLCTLSSMDLPTTSQMTNLPFKEKNSDGDFDAAAAAAAAATHSSSSSGKTSSRFMSALASVPTPVLSGIVSIFCCVAFSVGVVVPDRDLSVPLLAIPHASLSIVASCMIIHRSARIVFPTRSATYAVIWCVVLALGWGALDHVLIDKFVQEPQGAATFWLYAVPQILHVALEPSRTAWFLNADERLQTLQLD